MPIFHLHIKALSRANKNNALAAAAYRSASRLRSSVTGQEWDYKNKRGVISSEIIGWRDRARSSLWNAAENVERKSNAVVAREIEAAIPKELDDTQAQALATLFAVWLRDTYGVALEYSLHQPGGRTKRDRRPHCHFLMTTRRASRDATGRWQLGEKTREWDQRYSTKERLLDEQGRPQKNAAGRYIYVKKANPGLPDDTDENGRPLYGPENTELVRQTWQDFTNAALASAGFGERIDRRTLTEQGVDRDPVHRSRNAVEVSKKTGELTPQLKEMNRRERHNMLQEMARHAAQPVPLPANDTYTEEEIEQDETPEVNQKEAQAKAAKRREQRKQARKEKDERFAKQEIASSVARHTAAAEREEQAKTKAAPPAQPQAITPTPAKPRQYPRR
jgi:MobA/MobL family